MRKKALLSVALLAGIIGSTTFAQPANAQLADLLKNALGGQLGNQLGGQFSSQTAASPYNSLPQSGAGALLSNLLPYVSGINAGGGASLLDSLRPQNTNQYGNQQSNQYGNQSDQSYDQYGNGNNYDNTYDSNSYNSNNGYDSSYNNSHSQGGNQGGGGLLGSLGGLGSAGGLSGLTGFGAFEGLGGFGNVEPVVFNGVLLDSGFYSGPYRGSPHQVDSAMKLDWQMTVLKEQINLGASQAFLTSADAGMFASELNRLAGQKQRVVRRNGLSYNDSEELVIRLNSLVDRVRQAWYRSTFSNDSYGGNGRAWRGGRRNSSVSGRVITSGKNEALENLYLMTRPSGGYGR